MSDDLFPPERCSQVLGELASWTSVQDILVAARILEGRATEADNPADSLIMPLEHAEEAFGQLFAKLLKFLEAGYRVPPAKIDVARSLDPLITQATAEQLAALRFDPKLRSFVSKSTPVQRAFGIFDEPAVIELIRTPLICLMGIYLAKYNDARVLRETKTYYGKLTGGSPTIFHRPYADARLPSLIEAICYYVQHLDVGTRFASSDVSNIAFTYKSVNVQAQPPIGPGRGGEAGQSERAIDGTELFPYLDNVSAMGDQLSPACDHDLVSLSAGTAPWVDALHGNCWSWTPQPGAAVYGKTENFPPSPIDALGNGTFLRVPFRRIPIIDVHSVDEVIDIAKRAQSMDPNMRGVWRGQVRHHTTLKAGRTQEDLLRLYGATDVDEPSLLPSAARYKQYFPDSFATWSALLDLFVREQGQALGREQEFANFAASYRYRLWGFATAQHYGLPSVGLDVTHDINVALFFALHDFATDRTTGVTTIMRAAATESPIIYGLSGFADHELLDDSMLAPSPLVCTRPAAQGAMFFATGWGKAPNYAAQRIHVALRLVGHGEWSTNASVPHLFPKPSNDGFLRFLLNRKNDMSVAKVQDLLKLIYYVP